MSRRGSLNPNAQRGQAGGYDPNKRRPSAMQGDTKPNQKRNSISESFIKDGDVFYKTVRSFPSHPELGEEIFLSVAKPYDVGHLSEKSPSSLGTGGSSGRKSAQDSRRGSTMPERIREDSISGHHDEHGR